MEPAPRVGPTKEAPTGIQPGERIELTVMEDDSFSGSYIVRDRGNITIPKLGRVKVGGLSAAAAESAVRRQLVPAQLPKATVFIDRSVKGIANGAAAESLGTQIFLRGKVVRPGRYTVTGVDGEVPTVYQARPAGRRI